MAYNQLLILNTYRNIVKNNSTKQDNYHRAGSDLKEDIIACWVMPWHDPTH